MCQHTSGIHDTQKNVIYLFMVPRGCVRLHDPLHHVTALWLRIRQPAWAGKGGDYQDNQHTIRWLSGSLNSSTSYSVSRRFVEPW